MAAPPAPLPPDVMGQSSPDQAQSVFMAQGVGQPQPGMEVVQQIKAKLAELEQWLTDMLGMVGQFHPPMKATLMPIAQAGKELAQQTEQFAKKSGMAQGSPVVTPAQSAPNPAAGPPNPNAV